MSASISCKTSSTRRGSRLRSSPTALCMLYDANVTVRPLLPMPTIAGVGGDFLGGVLALARPKRRFRLGRGALLEHPQGRRLGVGRRLLLGERIELARFGRDEEARLDYVRVGNSAPHPLEQIAALGRH